MATIPVAVVGYATEKLIAGRVEKHMIEKWEEVSS